MDPIVKQLAQFTRAKGSFVRFYKNGVLQGKAFEDIPGGAYFPTISLFQQASATLNMGPYLAFPPEDLTVATWVPRSHPPENVFRAIEAMNDVSAAPLPLPLMPDLFSAALVRATSCF